MSTAVLEFEAPQPLAGPPVELGVPYLGEYDRRLAVFRGVMLAPHWALGFFVGLKLGFLTFVNYWIVLFTGRPRFVDFVSRALIYYTRVNGYALRLTDHYPPFSLSAPYYPAEVWLDPPEEVERWRMFVALLVGFPMFVVLAAVSVAAFVVGFFLAGLSIIFTGYYPEGQFLFAARVLRYQLRSCAYWHLMSNRFPGFSLDRRD